tara:strand:- start:1877 stop:2263 length:387 start_codon:yes stop_codon:yes gene_type:complete
MRKLFTSTLYVKVYANKISVKNVSDNGNWVSACPCPDIVFTTERLLVGNFSTAESLLRKLVKAAIPKALFTKRPMIVMQPVEKIEGGLSEVEERIFKELALGAGAIQVALHVGNELTDSEVAVLINNV